MRHSEWLAVAYFAYLGAAACIRRLPPVRRVSLLAIAAASSLAIVALAHGVVAGAGDRVRDWVPALYILVGYYASGLLAGSPSLEFEAWLAGWDRRWLVDDPARGSSFSSDWPRWLLVYLEVVYMGCFLLIPAGFAALAWQGQAALADRYWVMVLAAELGSFAPLAFVEARPPWALDPKAAQTDGAISPMASRWVHDLSIGVNTFPSGHAAGSLAVAFAVIGVLPGIGAVLLALAVSIAIACVVGRYHYVVDVVAGAALAAAVWALASLLYV